MLRLDIKTGSGRGTTFKVVLTGEVKHSTNSPWRTRQEPFRFIAIPRSINPETNPSLHVGWAVGSAVAGCAVVGSAVVGSAVVGSAVVGSAVVGSTVVGSLVPIGLPRRSLVDKRVVVNTISAIVVGWIGGGVVGG